MDEFVIKSFHPFSIDLSKCVDLLNTATNQKLLFAGLTSDDIPDLLPFFKEGGWPLNNERRVGDVRVALRLSEPEDTAEEWLLETVISSVKTARLWTPPVRKRHLPINQVLLEKWQPYAEDIQSLQKQMLDLIQLDKPGISSMFFYMKN